MLKYRCEVCFPSIGSTDIKASNIAGNISVILNFISVLNDVVRSSGKLQLIVIVDSFYRTTNL